MKEVKEEALLKREELAMHYSRILDLLGEDVEREGLIKTPEMVAKAMQFLTKGYDEDPQKVLSAAMFEEEGYKQMVIVKDIDFFSLCEHHMLPFFGKAHVAYIPNKYITGLSKIPRVVDIFARRLQIQERMTRQIAEIADAVGGKIDIICDGGVRRGSHVLKALAAGATACSGGRLYLYALAAAGEPGVDRVVGKLRDEIERGMKLMGVRSVGALDASMLRWR